jgi:hypothetical protein
MAKKKGGTPSRKKKKGSARTKQSKKPKPGRALEMLTARIEGALSGLDVTVKSPDDPPDLVAGGTREVDVSLRSKVGSAEVLVIVECRDRGRRADIQWIDQVKTKRDAVGAAKAIAVASGDFSKKALTAARAYGIDTRTLAQVNSAEIKRWAGTLTMSLHETFFDKLTVTVKLIGTDPLPQEKGTRIRREVYCLSRGLALAAGCCPKNSSDP